MIHLHCDVDNVRLYEREHGVAESFDPHRIYDQALPILLDLIEQAGARATFFVVGQDAALKSCREFCLLARSRGHEIGNHTFSHRGDLYRLSFADKEREIAACDDVLSSLLGGPIRAFRAPGYYLDRDVLEILMGRGYLYDSSVLPGVVNQLMGAVIRWQSGRAIDKTFGRRRYAFASQAITRITSSKDPTRSILELPIATLPLVRLPVHTTFIFLLGMGYFRLAAALLGRFQRDSVFLFHAIDTLDYPADGELSSKVPALRYSLQERRSMLAEMLRRLQTTGFTATSTRLVAEAPSSWRDSRLWA